MHVQTIFPNILNARVFNISLKSVFQHIFEECLSTYEKAGPQQELIDEDFMASPLNHYSGIAGGGGPNLHKSSSMESCGE